MARVKQPPVTGACNGFDVSKFADHVQLTSLAQKIVCAKCSASGPHLDVRPNWKEQPLRLLTGKVWG